MPDYRICAHRGFHDRFPENTLPAFAAAVAAGADELELDLWPTSDGRLVVCHDETVDRTTKGHGAIASLSAAEIRALDAALDVPAYGLPFFEDVLAAWANKLVLNIHVKSKPTGRRVSAGMHERYLALRDRYLTNTPLHDVSRLSAGPVLPEEEERDVPPYDEKTFRTLLACLDAFNCRDSVYITGEKDVLATARALAPDIARCCLEGHMNYSIVEHAVDFGCTRVQFCKTCLSPDMIAAAKNHHLICNLFWSDDPAEAARFAAAGIDVILANRSLS